VFRELSLHGGAAEIVWGYRPAVVLRSWRIAKSDGKWILRGAIVRVDKAQAGHRPLLFTAPRPGGFWAWPIESIAIGESSVRATLGPPVR